MPGQEPAPGDGAREYAVQSLWADGRWHTGSEHFGTRRLAEQALERLLAGPATLPNGSPRSPYRLVSRPVQRSWEVLGEPR